MFVKKFGVAVAAGLAAMAWSTPAAFAADAVTDAEAAVKNAQLDVDYFCAAESEYYDMAKCADAEDALADAKAKLEAAKEAGAADVASPVPDQTKADLEDAQLDAQYFCAEGTEYYDMVKCADLTAQIKDLEKKDAELDATWFCAEGTEYYDMVKCADAKERLGAGSGVTPDAPEVTPDAPSTAPDNSQSDAKKPAADATKPVAEAKAPKAKEAKGTLANTGASVASLMGAAAAIALAGGVMVARKRA
ncbi:hypothetical protein HMPREF3167_09005 [Trueperella sp. HMSC08B05]|uniref:hypothetical protein n=1 Tax=Trueperella sp. HMSC08B05 TaxID=1581135 RepID=UPI0008A43CCC|nr:hypothetical protein [Trueperella sp. HMSC08B05]OFS72031.1 hypothetical protein HMPREF3167_09005 [Trueperella sp. HMSC08B05]